MNSLWPALLSLAPALIGPLPQAQETLLASTCLGETIEIPLGDGSKDDSGHCHQQGCHGRCSRDGEDESE